MEKNPQRFLLLETELPMLLRASWLLLPFSLQAAVSCQVRRMTV